MAWGALTLPQRVQAEPSRQASFGEVYMAQKCSKNLVDFHNFPGPRPDFFHDFPGLKNLNFTFDDFSQSVRSLFPLLMQTWLFHHAVSK